MNGMFPAPGAVISTLVMDYGVPIRHVGIVSDRIDHFGRPSVIHVHTPLHRDREFQSIVIARSNAS